MRHSIPISDDQAVFDENKAPSNPWPCHALLSVPLEPDEIERIAVPVVIPTPVHSGALPKPCFANHDGPNAGVPS